MSKDFPLSKERTNVCALMTGRSPEELIAELRGAEADGADSGAVELLTVPEEFRNKECFARIINAVRLPLMFLLYRSDRIFPERDDEYRSGVLLTAADAGASIIDVMGDLFDKSPDERTRNAEAIARQKKLIKEIHSRGAKVIMSSHPQRFMTPDEVVDQLRDFESRGADVVKIVTKADTEEEFLQTLAATMKAHQELKIPFVHLANGKFGRIQRFAGLALGTAVTFAVHEYHAETPYNQPTIRSFKAAQQSYQWHVSDVQ